MRQVLRCALVLAVLVVGTHTGLAGQDEGPEAETFTVRGEVLDAVNGRPLVGVLVSLHDLWTITRTDELGYFEFPDVPVGAHELGVYGLGYLTFETYMEFVPDEIIAVKMDLAPVEVEGIEVAILSNSTEEYRSFGTRYDFIGGELMEEYKLKYGEITDMVRARFPGVRVHDMGGIGADLCVISTRGSSSPTDGNSVCAMILIDGLEQPGTVAAALHPVEIASIRFLSRIEARLVYGEIGKYGILLIETVEGERRSRR